jgi:NAD(P)-dependent dehydrogenase (short-subunit alcohol dehydrogenase family)
LWRRIAGLPATPSEGWTGNCGPRGECRANSRQWKDDINDRHTSKDCDCHRRFGRDRSRGGPAIGRALAVQADVSDAAEVERLFRSALAAFGRIDVVVNSAGIMPMGPIAEGSLEAFDRVIATNRARNVHRHGPGHQACRRANGGYA